MNLNYTINNGLQIAGIDTNSPILLDNDQIQDSNEAFFLWLKAHKGELKVVGNVATKDGHHQGQSLDYTYSKWMEVYKAFTDTGLKGVPVPVRGNSGPFRGSPENSVGADLIISEAKKCSPQRPLFILVGGQCSTVASAVAKDKSIIPNILVVHVDGKGNTQYNDINHEASTYLMDNGVSYLNWSGDLYGWYPGAGYTGWANAGGKPINRMPGFTFPTNINNPFYNIYRSNIARVYDAYGSTGDSPPAAYLVDHSVWQNVVRKTKNNQTVTGAYDYLLVSQNKWADYGPILSGFMNNPENYKQGTTPPVNVAPSVQITNTQTTLNEGLVTITAVSSDPDGTISKVEFFNGSNKIGEDLASPYSITWNAAKGTHIITAKATDNQGASTTSMAVTFTINTVIPPVEPPISVGPWENYIDVRRFGATGSGQDNDLPAFQAAVDAAIKVNGHLVIPSPKNFYRINDTWFIQPKESNQAYLNISSNGKYWSQLVYMGQSGKPAIQIVGEKWGRIQGLACKIGDGIIDSACYDIGTSQASTSTSAFTLGNCSSEMNTGINNVGFRLGKVDGFNGSDISQIQFSNCSSWGPHRVITGQIGFAFVGHNSLQFVISSGGSIFCDTGIKVTAGGAIAILGYGTSQNNTELHMTHSTQIAFTGGRFESSKRFLKVEGSANFTGVRISDALISDFKPTDGRLFDFQGNGGLTLDNVKIESSVDYGSGMITLGNGVGTLSVRGGAFNATDPFLTQGGWRAKIENVVRLNKDYQAIGYFTNK